MTTIRKVAKDANVSIATVSRVLNNQPGVSEAVRAKVLESVSRCGYVATVGKRATSYLGLMYTGPATLGSEYDAAMFAGMGIAVEESSLDLALVNMHRDKLVDETFTQFFLRKGVRGVVLRTTESTQSICVEIAAENFPALVVGHKAEFDAGLGYIYCDSRSTFYSGMKHLIELGHRRIALVISEVLDADHVDRQQAYTQAHQDHHTPLDPALCFRVAVNREAGAKVLKDIVNLESPPTAVVFTDPIVSVGALNCAHAEGIRIPEQLSILGFDDTDSRLCVFPKMSAVCQNARELGYEAFRCLADYVTSRTRMAPIRKELATWLELNDTIGPPSGGAGS